jgi:U5 small nuclear ribonucleoprotein component
VVVVINKIDRLIIEMKIPPEDAYLKLKHTLEEINGLFLKFSQQLGLPQPPPISPLHNNVLFASAEYSFMFSLPSFAAKYRTIFPGVDSAKFSSLLWGDYYFNRETRKFQRTPPAGERKRTFVEYILEPIYKIFAHTVGKDRPDLERFLERNLQLFLNPHEYKLNIKTLIKLIMKRYFGENRCLA